MVMMVLQRGQVGRQSSGVALYIRALYIRERFTAQGPRTVMTRMRG